MRVWLIAASVLLAGRVTPAEVTAAGEVDASHARLSRATSRCTALADLIACGEALSLKPNDPQLLLAEGEALVRRNRPGEAIGVFRNAAKQSQNSLDVQGKIAAAEAQRRTLLATCISQEGDVARTACEAAWLPGALEEAALFRRRGELLQKAGQLPAALDAFMAAARLRPNERSAAQAIVELSERLGREDAATLLAKGQALLVLGHPVAALSAFRRASKLSPNSAEVRARLRVAERLQPPSITAPSDSRRSNGGCCA